jgi:phosphoribosylamine--glycine ligase
MGAYSSSQLLDSNELSRILDSIMLPTLAQMAKEGYPFTGFLYAGLMMTADGPKVLEFNARMGDPETQAILCGMEGSLAEILEASANGENPKADLSRSTPAACVVMAAEGYPEKPRSGALISGIDEAEKSGTKVFQAGTRMAAQGLETAGGRVLGVTAAGDSIAVAIRKAYRGVSHIRFEGMQFRTDIGKQLMASGV